MLDYIKNLLPRLEQYSKDLDKIENFVDKKWRFIDSSNETLSIIFLRDNRVIISKVTNGTDQKTIEGSWELLPNKELYLKRPEPILLKQGFIGEGILILQESGTSNNPFCCYDPKKITETEINNYLDGILQNKNALGGAISSPAVQLKLNSEGEPFTGFERDMADTPKYSIYIDGRLAFHGFRRDYDTDNGLISVFQKQGRGIIQGDFVFVGTAIAEDKRYTIKNKPDKEKANCYGMKVINGKVAHTFSLFDVIATVTVVLIFLLIILFIVFLQKSL